MKKLVQLFLSVSLLFTFAGCKTSNATETNSYHVAIVKLMDHESLNEIADAISLRLDEIAKEKNTTITYTVYSGQGEASNLQQIAQEILADKVDAIVPIATLTAQIMVTAAEEKNIPVVFSAISDPEGAGLTGIDYVTGTSDALDTKVIMDMMLAAQPNLKKVGLLYSQSEKNSEKPIAEAKSYLEAKGIEVVPQTGNNAAEILQATSSLIASEVQAVFTPTDNIVMENEASVAESLNKASIPHYVGADSFVRLGAFATCGVNYTELGKQTANYTYQAITENVSSMEDYYTMDGGIVTVNTETASTLNLDYSSFQQFGTIVETTTASE